MFVGNRAITGRQQIDTKTAAANATARIDAWTENETKMIWRERGAGVCNSSQGGHAMPVEMRQSGETTTHKGAVHPGQWHHVANGCEANKVKGVTQIGRDDVLFFVPAGIPQGAI